MTYADLHHHRATPAGSRHKFTIDDRKATANRCQPKPWLATPAGNTRA